MAHKPIKRYPSLSLIRKMQIKTSVTYYYFLPPILEKIINKMIIYYVVRKICTIIQHWWEHKSAPPLKE